MKRSIGSYAYIWLLVSGIALYLVSLLTGEISAFEFSGRSVAQDFHGVLHNKEIVMHDLLSEMDGRYGGKDDGEFWKYFLERTDELGPQGLAVAAYVDDSLAYWSDNSISLDPVFSDSLFTRPLVRLNHGFYERSFLVDGRIRFIGLILIKESYQYQNNYLKNDFQDDFSVPPDTKLVPGDNGSIKIHSVGGEFLFCLDISGAPPFSPQQVYFSFILYLGSIVLITLFLGRLLVLLPQGKKRDIGLIFYALSLLLVYVVICKLAVPKQFVMMGLFKPERFAVSSWFSSLSDLLVWSYFVFLLVYQFYIHTHGLRVRPGFGNLLYNAGMAVYFILLILFYGYANIMFSNLVRHSSISFLAYRVMDIDVLTFVGFLVVGLNYAAFALLADKFIILFRPRARLLNGIIYPLAFVAGNWLMREASGAGHDVFLSLFPLCILVIPVAVRYGGGRRYSHGSYVLFVLLFSILSVYQVMVLSARKQASRMKVLAVDLSAEHDPVAELLLQDIEGELRSDPVLARMTVDPYVDEQQIYDYLTDAYFKGFWEKYDLQPIKCSPVDSVFVWPPVNRYYHCYDYFAQMIDSFGIRIPNSDFYFFDNLNGRISYFTAIPYGSADSMEEATLFLELDSRMISRDPGYPSLLLSDRLQTSEMDEQLSYAKYHRSGLITQYGDSPYSLTSDKYGNDSSEYEFIRLEGRKYLVYRPDPDNTIVVSRPVVRLLDVVITFTYIFMFFYLCLSLNILMINASSLKGSFRMNIKNKIQYSVLLILVLSLILIGGGSIYYSVRQYKLRQYDNLKEKIQSVYVELTDKLGYEEELGPDWQSGDYRNLDELLRKFSNIFYTDIHLFDTTGQMIATSRPEIFEKGLLGQRINSRAYYRMAVDRSNEFVNQEQIGSLKFLSAYVPFFNVDNKLLAYLNLPYFTRQDVLTREITNMVVGIVNFYVLLISLSVLVAVFISVRITQPLQMLQSKFGKISLEETNEKIDYQSDDEIGGLVREYNHMVDQLAKSAELLARSERESAWREMAKQIAHEIKNPLTPMKLSVQHLKRSWKDNPDNWEQNLERISQTLIEQIDTLSAIATGFSNFAQMPRADNVRLDLGAHIRRTVELFVKSDEVNLVTELDHDPPLIVFADKEQLSSVFMNLVKNAIQAIPSSREGEVRILLDREENHARVMISDNGNGIPEDLGDKLFQPNFTTKSSGMGMGLAIVKNIVDHAGGSIAYETKVGEGTTFIVKLPLAENNEDE